MLAKIDVWFSRRKVQKAMAKISPRYLARSPVNIRNATKFMTEPLGNFVPCRRLRFVSSRGGEDATSNLRAQFAVHLDCLPTPSPSRIAKVCPSSPHDESLADVS